MGRPYTQLTHYERDRIEHEMSKGTPLRQIARALGRSASTLIREVRRNGMTAGRYRFGDGEIDTIRGPVGHPMVLLSAVDRCTRLTKLCRVPSRKAADLNAALCSTLTGLPVQTLTVDNGMEFASHIDLSARIGSPVFFAHEQCPCQRGTNENTNGLVRHYLPKFSPIELYSDAQIARIERLLNHRPRKCLGFRKPIEVARECSLLHL